MDIDHEPRPIDAGKPPAAWPTSGDLRVENLSARYSQVSETFAYCYAFLNRALHSLVQKYCITYLSILALGKESALVSVTSCSRERSLKLILAVGRTGSGKVNTLFIFIEPLGYLLTSGCRAH